MRSKKEFTTDYSGKLYREMTDPCVNYLSFTLDQLYSKLLPKYDTFTKYPKITPRSIGSYT